MKIKKIAKVWLIGAVLTTSAQAGVVLIDDFSVDHGLIFGVGAGGSSFTTASGSPILGSERDLHALVVSGSVTAVEVTGGSFESSISSGSVGTVTITYDGSDGSDLVDTAGLGGIDISNGGSGAFEFEVTAADTSYTILTTVWSTATDFSTHTYMGTSGAATVLQDFSLFSTAGGAGADFTSVNAIQTEFNGNGLDMIISNFATVPEPSSAILLGFSAFGLITRRKRR